MNSNLIENGQDYAVIPLFDDAHKALGRDQMCIRDRMKILLLDNYDSFTYNLLHAVKELGATDVEVVRNDQIELDEGDSILPLKGNAL